MEIKYPSVEQVLKATQDLAPKGWEVTYEWPDQIGVYHPTLTNDQFIFFGDINGFFTFNDAFSDGCGGYMEGLTDPKEIAESFWQQVSTFYPNLIKGE